MTPTTALIPVLNEQDTIAGCVESAAAAGCVAVLLLDTGCEDETISRAEYAAKLAGIDIYHRAHKWAGFADARNALLDGSRELHPNGYSLFLDADERVTGKLPNYYGAEGYYLCRLLAGDWENWGIKLVSNAAPWRFEGAVHEVPVCLSAHTTTKLPGVEIVNLNNGRSGNMDEEEIRERYRRESMHFRDQLDRNPYDTRAAYYYAQSLMDGGMLYLASCAFERRLSLAGGFEEERYLSALYCGQLRARMGQSRERVESMLTLAMEMRPHRNEARVALCQYLYGLGEFERVLMLASVAPAYHPIGDLFLVRRSARTLLPAYWRAVAAARLRDPQAARAMLVNSEPLPHELRAELELVCAGR